MTHRFLLAFTFLVISISLTAKENWEYGYYINNKNEKISGFIKNEDWKLNPNHIEFKEYLSAFAETINIDAMKEFNINDEYYYQKHQVTITDHPSELLLKVIVNGSNSLYAYKNQESVWYFYKAESDDNLQRLEPDSFQSQLEQIQSTTSIEKLKYEEKSLIDYFSSMNRSSNTYFKVYTPVEEEKQFKLQAKVGLQRQHITLTKPNTNTRYKHEFDTKNNISVGLELEAYIAYMEHRWAIITGLNTQFYSISKVTEFNYYGIPRTETIDLTNNTINLPIGVRRYFFITQKSKIHLDLIGQTGMAIKKELTINNTSLDIDQFQFTGKFGIGYSFNDMLILSGYYCTQKEILHDYGSWSAKQNCFEIVLGYYLF